MTVKNNILLEPSRLKGHIAIGGQMLVAMTV